MSAPIKDHGARPQPRPDGTSPTHDDGNTVCRTCGAKIVRKEVGHFRSDGVRGSWKHEVRISTLGNKL